MPYVVPNIPYSFGSRAGATSVNGTLNPEQDGPISRVGGSIWAYPPLGTITVTTSWGFVVGQAPSTASALIVAARGRTTENGAAYNWGGGYSAANSSIALTAEEFVNGKFTRSTTTSLPIMHIWTAVIGAQFHAHEAWPTHTLLMGVGGGAVYRCWVTANQWAMCQGIPAYAASRLFFDFYPVFYSWI